MNREEMRLEILKLTYTHGRETSEAVGRAKALEDYIFEQTQSEANPKTLEKPKSKAGNSK